MEQIKEFIAFEGAYEISSLLENIDDGPYKSESFAILKYCMDYYKNDNCYISEYLKGLSPLEEETNAMQEPMEEEIAEIRSSLDEKEEESDEQKEEEWSYPCLPSNESNSLTHTLFNSSPWSQKENECYYPIDSFETSLFDKMILLYMIIRAILINLMIIQCLIQPL